MIAMSPTVTLKGSVKFSLKKMVVGGEMSKSQYTGPGELLLAPAAIGDITIIKLSGQEQWSVGKDAFLACTQGVVTEYKSQGLGKAMFSGEGLFVYKISGQGIIFVTSFGAIIRKDVSLPISCPYLAYLMGTLHYVPQRGTLHWPIANCDHSSNVTRSTSSTTDIWLPGIANTFSSV